MFIVFFSNSLKYASRQEYSKEILTYKIVAENSNAVIERGHDDREATITFSPDVDEQRRLMEVYAVSSALFISILPDGLYLYIGIYNYVMPIHSLLTKTQVIASYYRAIAIPSRKNLGNDLFWLILVLLGSAPSVIVTLVFIVEGIPESLSREES